MYVLRTNIEIEDALIAEAMRLSGCKAKRETVHYALVDYVAVRSRKNLMDLKGKIEFAEGYDYKDTRKSDL